jgi:hypothetical protein
METNKKRGRPRKNVDTSKIINKPTPNINNRIYKNENNDCSINIFDIETSNNDHQNDSIIFHFPIKYDTMVKHSKKIKKIKQSTEIIDMSSDFSEVFTMSSESDSGGVCEKCLKNADVVKILKNELSICKDKQKKSIQKNNNCIINPNIATTSIDNLIQINDKTDILCWWCCHEFDERPFVIPEKYYQDTYYVYGCFCSLNCASSFNAVELNDYKVSERESFLKKMYNVSLIEMAPKRQILKKFGGPLTIKEYRSNFVTNNSNFIVTLPPLNYIIVPVTNDNNNEIIGIRNSDELVIKRTKPLPSSKNNLYNTMGIKIK